MADVWESWWPLVVEQLEAAWRRKGASIAEHLAPGATSEHLRELEAQSGLTIPPELVAWWSWHDGVTPTRDNLISAEHDMGVWRILSAAEAFAEHRGRWQTYGLGPPQVSPEDAIRMAAEHDPENWQGEWLYTWLPVFKLDANVFFVDCTAVTPRGTVPVRYHDHTPEDVFTPSTGSMTAFLATMAFMIDTDIMQWQPGHYWSSVLPDYRNPLYRFLRIERFF
jgi:cell wall assembly regulator SMI1